MGSLTIYVASEPRWMLETMQTSRKKGGESKSLPIAWIEERLGKMVHAGGEARLNAFRDSCRDVAQQIGLEKEFEKLNRIISALLSTHSADALVSQSAKAMSAGIPYDMDRAELLTILYDALKERLFVPRLNKNITESSFRLFSFFESYFSNFIEGTEFTVEEAKEIVDTGIALPKRIDDSHDILGTFQILSNRSEMNIIPATETDLTNILRRRHNILLVGRPDMEPGVFKTRKNRAGNTEFVAPELVEGTLRYGFRLYVTLNEPLARAIYMMFLCSEVHPFNDGNGRVARIMMNAELVHGNQTRIIVPTVFREDYILSLRKLSRSKDPAVFIQVMERLQTFSDNLYGDDFQKLSDYLQRCNAFEEPERGRLHVIDREIGKHL
jgi:hypothetical protein